MLSACSYVYADKFTACVQNVRLPNVCMHRNVSCIHFRCSASAYYHDMLLMQN